MTANNRESAKAWNQGNFKPEALRLLEMAAEALEGEAWCDDRNSPLLTKVIRQFIDDTKTAKGS